MLTGDTLNISQYQEQINPHIHCIRITQSIKHNFNCTVNMFAPVSNTHLVDIFSMCLLLGPILVNKLNKPQMSITNNLVNNRSSGHPASTMTPNMVNSPIPSFHTSHCRFNTHRTCVCLHTYCIHYNPIHNLNTVTGRDMTRANKLFSCRDHPQYDSQPSIMYTALSHYTAHSC
jgi:hypothetical protein